MAFVEQFIYLCLRHLTVLRAATHRIHSDRITINESAAGFRIKAVEKAIEKAAKKTVSQAIRKNIRVELFRTRKDDCNTDRTSGGLLVRLATKAHREFGGSAPRTSFMPSHCGLFGPTRGISLARCRSVVI